MQSLILLSTRSSIGIIDFNRVSLRLASTVIARSLTDLYTMALYQMTGSLLWLLRCLKAMDIILITRAIIDHFKLFHMLLNYSKNRCRVNLLSNLMNMIL